MIIILTFILLTGMYVYKSINPFYALFKWSHSSYWWVITKGEMALHPKDPKFKYLKMCDNIHGCIKHFKIFELFAYIDHKYAAKLRYKVNHP